MNGKVRKDTKRGTWLFVVDGPGVDGKRRQIKRSGFRTRDDATTALDALRRELWEGTVPVPNDDTVEAFTKAWVAALPVEGLEPATVKSYRDAVKRLLPHIGPMELQDLTTPDLDGAYAALLARGLSARSVRASHVAVRKMLAEALRVKLVGRNVSDDARPPSAKSARAKQFDTWTAEQLAAFLGAVAEHEHYVLWYVAAYTGMRREEVVALRWADVDLDHFAIRVARAVGKGIDGFYEKVPKSDASGRTVELDGPLVEVLRQHRRAQTEARLAHPAWHDGDFVFPESDGSIMVADRLTVRWAKLVKAVAPKLGVPVIRFHDQRHSHATQLLAAGVRPDVVTERLGHASVAFTLQRYAHRYIGDQRSGLAKLRAVAELSKRALVITP